MVKIEVCKLRKCLLSKLCLIFITSLGRGGRGARLMAAGQGKILRKIFRWFVPWRAVCGWYLLLGLPCTIHSISLNHLHHTFTFMWTILTADGVQIVKIIQLSETRKPIRKDFIKHS